MTSTRKRLAGGGTVAAALMLVAGALVLPARASLQEGFEVAAGAPVERTFPALVGIDPSNRGAADLTPPGCDNVPVCDHIPMNVVVPPGLSEEDLVSVLIEVSWDNPSGSNDLDVYAFDNQQIQGATYAGVGKAATGSNPEKLRIANAVLGEYNLVVRNMNGVNTGYTVKARLSTEPFESPVEQLAPPPSKPAEKPVEESKPPAEAQAPTPGPSTPTTLASIVTQADDDFDFGPSSFDDELQAPPIPNFDAQQAAAITKAKAGDGPSGVSVVLAFVVVPVVILAGLGAVLVRRRRAMSWSA